MSIIKYTERTICKKKEERKNGSRNEVVTTIATPLRTSRFSSLSFPVLYTYTAIEVYLLFEAILIFHEFPARVQQCAQKKN